MDDAILKAASIPTQVVAGAAVALNLLVVAVFARTKRLHVKYYGFVFNLVLADIAYPTMLIVFIHQKNVPIVVALVRAAFLTAQLSILAVAVSRLLALSLMPPARYDAVVTPARMVLACVSIWILSAVLFVPTTYLKTPNVNWLIQALIPLTIQAITGVLYAAVFRKITKYRPPLASAPAASGVEDEQARTRVRQTRHLMVTFTIIFVVSAVCWIPFCVGFLILFAHGELVLSVVIYLRYSYAVLVMNSAVNPFIYWWRFSEGRKGFYQLMCCGPEEDRADIDVETVAESVM